MDKFYKLCMKIEILDACFYAMDNLVAELNSGSKASIDRLTTFFYMVYDILTKTKEEIREVEHEMEKVKLEYVKRLEEENEALKKKLEAYVFI